MKKSNSHCIKSFYKSYLFVKEEKLCDKRLYKIFLRLKKKTDNNFLKLLFLRKSYLIFRWEKYMCSRRLSAITFTKEKHSRTVIRGNVCTSRDAFLFEKKGHLNARLNCAFLSNSTLRDEIRFGLSPKRREK